VRKSPSISRKRWLQTSITVSTYSAIRRFAAKGIADRDPARQRGEVDQFDAGGHRLHQPHARRRRVFRAPVIRHQDAGIGRDLWGSQQVLRLSEDLDPQAVQQFGLNTVRRGDNALAVSPALAV
jgi:hypothetical protein